MPKPTLNGSTGNQRARRNLQTMHLIDCRAKRSGNTLHEPAFVRLAGGATASDGTTPIALAAAADGISGRRRLSAVFLPTHSDCTTSSATSRNGPKIAGT